MAPPILDVFDMLPANTRDRKPARTLHTEDITSDDRNEAALDLNYGRAQDWAVTAIYKHDPAVLQNFLDPTIQNFEFTRRWLLRAFLLLSVSLWSQSGDLDSMSWYEIYPRLSKRRSTLIQTQIIFIARYFGRLDIELVLSFTLDVTMKRWTRMCAHEYDEYGEDLFKSSRWVILEFTRRMHIDEGWKNDSDAEEEHPFSVRGTVSVEFY